MQNVKPCACAHEIAFVTSRIKSRADFNPFAARGKFAGDGRSKNSRQLLDAPEARWTVRVRGGQELGRKSSSIARPAVLESCTREHS